MCAALSDITNSLHGNNIEDWLSSADSDISTVAYVLGVDPHYLAVQVRLHLPYYDINEVSEKGSLTVIREILQKIKDQLSNVANIQALHGSLNGVAEFGVGATVKAPGNRIIVSDSEMVQKDIFWGTVPSHFGNIIQRDLHYIHSIRKDTFLHAGLFLETYSAPFCYASFSDLDREYLISALRAATRNIDLGTNLKIAVMTRAYGYVPNPKNAMSKLFDLSGKELASRGYDLVVTALNPFLGFQGSVFGGASFASFATSPMKYWYDKDGNYITRRNGDIKSCSQRMKTPPILWLVKPLSKRLRRKLEGTALGVYHISDDEYARG